MRHIWSAGAGRRIHMTGEERAAHAQGARREDTLGVQNCLRAASCTVHAQSIIKCT